MASGIFGGVASKTLKFTTFTSSGSFVVPKGVNWVWAAVIGGGGGGDNSHTASPNGGNGGSSSFGPIVAGGGRGGRNGGSASVSGSSVLAMDGPSIRSVALAGYGAAGVNGSGVTGSDPTDGAFALDIVPVIPGDAMAVTVGAGGVRAGSSFGTTSGTAGAVALGWLE